MPLWGWILIGILIALSVLMLSWLGVALVLFRVFFKSPSKKPSPAHVRKLLGPSFSAYLDHAKAGIQTTTSLPHQTLSILSFDDLPLTGFYFRSPYSKGILLVGVHGYNSDPISQFGEMAPDLLAHGYDLLLIGLRHDSNPGLISFGVNERKDVSSWLSQIGTSIPSYDSVYLYGISMGGATVLQCLLDPLPSFVKGVIDDCGFTAYPEVAQSMAKTMAGHAFPLMVKTLVWLGKAIGGFDLNRTDVRPILRKASLPVLFLHGEKDAYVPFAMGEANAKACASFHRLIAFPNAAHGQSYFSDPDAYRSAIDAFVAETSNR